MDNRARRHVTAASLDVVSIVVFAAIGRRSHDESNGLGGVLSTAAPFLLALVAGWTVATLVARRRPQLRDGSSPEAVVVIWIVTVGLGLLARRVLWGRGTAFAFVVVATLVLGAFLVVRRLAWRSFDTRHNRA